MFIFIIFLPRNYYCRFFEMSGNTFDMVVYASPPLSGGGVELPNAKLATFRTMRLPVALELLELLATFNIP